MLILLVNYVSALSFVMQTRNEHRCFNLHTAAEANISMAYMISAAKEKSVIVTMFSPQNTILYRNPLSKREERMEIKASTEGIYKLCFHNIDANSKVITFDFEVFKGRYPDFTAGSELDPLNTSFKKGEALFTQVFQSVGYQQTREAVNRDIIESTCDRVSWFMAIKAGVMIFIASLQVISLTKPFTNYSSSV